MKSNQIKMLSRHGLPLVLSALLPVCVLAETTLPTGVNVDPLVAKLRDKALHDHIAWEIVESVTTEVGPRPDGSEAEARARTWAVAKLKALGFQNVRIETYTLPIWQRGQETAEVLSPYPQALHVTALGNSGATPAEGLTLPVVFFPTYNDLLLAPDESLNGKIAFVSNHMKATQDASSYGAEGQARFNGPNVAAKKGAAAIVIRSIGSDHSNAPHTGATRFDDGVKPIPAAALSVADAGNLERMISRSKDPLVMHLTVTPKFLGDKQSGNVMGDLPGSDKNTGVIVVGGHLDSWDFGTGALDDGAGIAITAAAAKIVHDAGPHRRTIRVVWFGDEETGGYGGKAYAKAHVNERHDLAAESDLGADCVWQFKTNFPESAKAIAERLAVALSPLGVVRSREIAGDGTDVTPIFRNGVAAVDLDQDASRYFNYHHTSEDVLERIDLEQFRQNVAAWTAMLAVVANAPEDIGKVKAKVKP